MFPPSYIQRAQEGNSVNEAQVNWHSRGGAFGLRFMTGGTCPAMKEQKKTSPTTSFVSFLLSSNLKLSLSTQEMLQAGAPGLRAGQNVENESREAIRE